MSDEKNDDIPDDIFDELARAARKHGTQNRQRIKDRWIARAWAIRITERWRGSVESIIETGRLINQAKKALPHGEFGHMLANSLPFGERMAQMLMAIAGDLRLSNPQFIALLPPSWGTIYDVTRLSDEEIKYGIEARIIRPEMERADVELIRPLTHRTPHESQAKEPEADVTDAQGGDGAQGSSRHVAGRTATTTSENLDVTAGETAPHSASMPGGGLAIAHRRIEDADSLDYFPTPPWATRALVEHVLTHLERRGHCKWQTAWEPACGEGHMAEVLCEYFKIVAASDIHPYGYGGVADFHKAQPAPVDWIITNPPFNASADFVLKAINLAGTGVAMFVRLQWLETEGRYERIFRDHPPTLIAFFAERVPLHKGRWEPEGGTFTAYIWLLWIKGCEPRAPFWIPPGCREALSKLDDVERFTATPVRKRQQQSPGIDDETEAA